jgi:hypothetical protein
LTRAVSNTTKLGLVTRVLRGQREPQ